MQLPEAMRDNYLLLLNSFSLMQVYPVYNGNSGDSVHSDSSMKEDAQSSFNNFNRQGYGHLYQLLLYASFIFNCLNQSFCFVFFILYVIVIELCCQQDSCTAYLWFIS